MPSENKLRTKSAKETQWKSRDRRQKHPDASSHNDVSVPVPALLSTSRRSPSKKNSVLNVEDIKNKAFRTEDLTQRAHRFIFQLAIDLREKLQSEFDALEMLSADPRSTVPELEVSLIAMSSKMSSEIEKQMDVQKKIAEAYEAMYKEVNDMAKHVLNELDTTVTATDERNKAAHQLNDVMNVIRETVEYWSSRPVASRQKLHELKRDTPKDTMTLAEMFEHLDLQVKHCHKALEHPMGGKVSISREFTKLNISRKSE